MKSVFSSVWLAVISLLLIVSFAKKVLAVDDGLVAYWKFEEGQGERTADSVGKIEDVIKGNSKYIRGSSGNGLRFDGFTTVVVRESFKAPRLGDACTFEAWISIQAYPWGLCAIVNQEKEQNAGYFFGIDSNGYIHLQLAIAGNWQICKSESKIPLMRWSHIAGTYDALSGMTVYINGKEVGRKVVTGRIKFAPDVELQIGRNNQKRPPEHTIRLNIPLSYSFDGYIDELKIHNRALSVQEIAQIYKVTSPTHGTDMTFRKLPDKPKGPTPFGAYYCKLDFCETWDALWRVGPHSDVVVLFDDAPFRFVFWRGTNYIPCWVTQNDIWYTNEFNETWLHGALGCAEPMSDKQCRHSHVRIIESNDARVVIHWRYALVDVRYVFARVDEMTEWGDWSDEYYTIYPDGIGIRKINLWSSQPLEPHEFQESIILNQPGTKPEDNIETEALTMVNMRGETYTYSWAEQAPQAVDKPTNANIEYINIKSDTKPFLIVSDKKPRFLPYKQEIKREVSIFPWWNHWPVAQIPSDGRWATELDRVSHSSLTSGLNWEDYEITENTRVRIMMHGLTAKPAKDLVPLAKSWLRAPELNLISPGYSSKGYDQSERAYILSCKRGGNPEILDFEISANEEHPIVNPAFIIKGWGRNDAVLKINDKKINRGKDFRFGHRKTPQYNDLIVWVNKNANLPVRFSILPVEQ